MTDFQVAAVLITLTAGLAYVNARLLRLPSAIGLMATALVGSIVVAVRRGATRDDADLSQARPGNADAAHQGLTLGRVTRRIARTA
jgi:hypothetical protein